MDASTGAHEATVYGVAPQALLDAIIEMSDDAILMLDSAGLVTMWSGTAERLFGSRAADVLQGSLELLFPEHLRSDVQAAIATVRAGDRIHHFETEVVRPDGMPVPISLSMSPVSGPGKQSGSVVIARDVTEQRLAQASLAEVEARLEEGESLAHAGSWLWDLRTGAVQWSAEFHHIHGVDPLDFDGTLESHLGLIHPADRDRVRLAMEDSVASGRSFESEYRVVRPEGGVRVLQVRAQATIGSAGNAVGLRGVGQDVTDRHSGSVNRNPPIG